MRLALELVIVITSILEIVLVLLHKSKGGGLSSMFGGGVQSNLAGSATVEKNLNRITVYIGLIWFFAIVGLSFQIIYA